jgi:hypothetical protein
MRAFWLVSAFVIFILSGHVSMPMSAYAACCTYPGCTSPVGCTKCSGGCPNCCPRMWSLEIFQTTLITDNRTSKVSAIENSQAWTLSSLIVMQKFSQLARGSECDRRGFTLWMLGNPEPAVLTASMGYAETGAVQETFAFNIEPQNNE